MRPGGEVTTNTDTSTNTDGGRNEEDSTKPTEQRKKGLTGGAIAGIIISCVVVVAGICVSVFFIIIKNKKAPVCAKP
ncbi:hypothetical protein TRFO_17187 [Tritrichomonas foetus]|uniref:Uncharacterized protein n=1 Tax=Tritrichomonas foetus TaxID=1144522 RepID=A0A1J4KNK4_9EUKA|nr:hypothetical protein TRFO_17187 [Tritrichomonas foetus]|eukprot:OHT12827.1 hypothetical protein TRFO_17187 [Tritrichomonas foetus]